MSDENVTLLARRWHESGDEHDRAAWLRACARLSPTLPTRLDLAAPIELEPRETRIVVWRYGSDPDWTVTEFWGPGTACKHLATATLWVHGLVSVQLGMVHVDDPTVYPTDCVAHQVSAADDAEVELKIMAVLRPGLDQVRVFVMGGSPLAGRVTAGRLEVREMP